MVQDAWVQHGDKIYDIKVSVGIDSIFVFEKSLPNGVVPGVGDKIFWNLEEEYLMVKSVTPLFSKDHEWSNYQLELELP